MQDAPIIRQMFNRISHRYDLLNRILSGGIDIYWRKRLARMLHRNQPRAVLDIATGTGDLICDILKNNQSITSIHGIDIAEQMLDRAKEKMKMKNLDSLVTLEVASATNLPYSDASFDATTISFGIRNVKEKEKAFSEMLRILRPGGFAYILEFSMPKHLLPRLYYLFHLRVLVPFFGGLIGGDRKAYQYLNSSIEQFDSPEIICESLEKLGFSNIEAHPLTFGAVTLYVAKK
ncbi:MAG: Demethylmenaquinone methyltransferase [Chlamydiia bacterium]|nr:Demethylmenaquinone methyltransferase [Chlamydiia bacterium]